MGVISELGAISPNDAAAGALFEFHRANAKYPNSPASKISGSEFVGMVDKDQPNWRTLFGKGLIQSELSPAKINSAMQSLASKFKGQIPNRRGFGKFFDAVMGKMTNFDLARDAIGSATVDTVKAGSELAVSTGKSLAAAVKLAPFIYMTTGIVALLMFVKSKSGARAK